MINSSCAALSALSAVEDARARLMGTGIKFRAAYHIGEIHYGNIGGQTRLDFTAIGPTVNLTARLLDAASRKEIDAVCSSAFAKLVQDRVEDLGAFEFKGFAAPQQVFSVR
jgi:adenylate cyclase